MPFDVDFLASFAGSGGGDPVDPGTTFEQITFSTPPALAELERLWRERWHTRPNWWIAGTAPKTLPANVADLPAGLSWNGSARTLTVSGTVALLDGWEFYDVEIIVPSGTRITTISNCKFMPRSYARSERAAYATGTLPPRACFNFGNNQNGTVGAFIRCWFTMREDHEGVGGASSFVQSNMSNGVGFAGYEAMRFCELGGYFNDAVKPTRAAIHEHCVFDSGWSVPPDAELWQSGKTYNRNDVVWGGSANRLRICKNNNVTSAPNFQGALSSTADWEATDPHHDTLQCVGYQDGQVMRFYGCVSNRNSLRTRFPQRTTTGGARGVVNWLRFLPNNTNANGADHGILEVQYNLIFDEFELAFNNSDPIVLPSVAQSYGKASNTKLVENNWYQTRLTSSSGTHITVRNNVSDWQFPSPATLANLAATHTGNSLTIGFTPSLGGWMRLVVTASPNAMTVQQIIRAREGDSGILALGEIEAQTNTAAFGTTPLALGSGQTVYVHAIYQAGAGSDTLLPVLTVTQGSAAGPMLELNELEFDGYVFDGTDQSHAPVRLSGTGPAGAKVQVRGESAGGNTAWEQILVEQDGTWAVTLNVAQADWGHWYTPAVRFGTDDTTKILGTNTFGCGHVVGILGQSEYVHWLTTSPYRNQLARELDAETLTVVLADLDDATDITTARITAANLTEANVGTLAVANAVRQIVGDDRKLMIVDLAHQGTSPFALWNDADAGRNWSTLEALVAKVRASGSEFGRIIMNWYNAPAASIPTMLQDWAPGMFGQLSGGGAFTLGGANTDGVTQTGPVDHCFWDIEADPSVPGRGLFARGRTKLHLMLPMPMHDTTGTNSAFDESKRVSNDARASVLAFAADARVQSFLEMVGPGAHLADFDENNTTTSQSTHPNRLDALGIPWFACQQVPGIARAAGVDLQEPQITGVTQVNATTVDVTVSLPNGGTLTTLAGLGVGNHPATTTAANIPHLHDVVGFQIDRAGTKRPVFNGAGGASEPSLYRGTVTISDSGSGAGAARSGTVRIVLDQPIAAGDQLTYLDGQANAVLDEIRDETARLYNFMLLEHVPGWSDAGSLYPYHGVPVRPQTPMTAF